MQYLDLSTPAKPAADSPPSVPLAKSSDPKFPPGQWVNVFTKAEEIPAQLLKQDVGGKWENGTLSAANINQYFGLRAGSTILKNGALRAKISGKFTARLRNTDKVGNYGFTDHSIEYYGVQKEGTPIGLKALQTFNLPGLNETHHWEFAVVGNRLISRRDGDIVASVTDDHIPSGTIMFSNLEGTLRDIEVINLDGLSETEVLKLVGVDEKGNDVRAAAIAQEKQAMEQAKVVDAASSIPELKALHDHFVKLTAERITAPFDADVAKLNAGYVGGIDRKIAAEKAAGQLDGVIALEAEKKLLADQHPIPAEDADGTTANLKALRAIYRAAYTKIDAARAANLKQLTDPLALRLKQLEADLTKQDRVPDAKSVREYREALGEITPAPLVVSAPPKPSAPPLSIKDGYTNTLGMKFLPVKGTDVLFCIHEVRYKDYATYAAEASGVSGSWKDQSGDGYTPTENTEQHPVMRVSWEDAQKFCAWLSQNEGKTYRLPTDEEWSVAVGLGRAEKRPKGTTPEMLSQKETTEFPWGGDYPPKTKDKAGNYSDASRKAKAPNSAAQYLEDYDDGFPLTAPVMSFKPNKFGLYDMEGNVREYCEDWFNAAQKERVVRGGSWNAADRGGLLSSARYHTSPGYYLSNYYGFRVVLAVSAPKTAGK